MFAFKLIQHWFCKEAFVSGFLSKLLGANYSTATSEEASVRTFREKSLILSLDP